MQFKALIKEFQIRKFAAADLELTSIPAGGRRLIQDVARRFPSDCAAFARRRTFDQSLEITSNSHASSSWYSGRNIRFLVWEGDLVIDGDFVDDDWESLPLLLIRGNLAVRNWLRGGMPTFVGGSVHAAGFIVGHYDDSALFVGGNLAAAGYLPRAKPYPEFPDMAPHQIAGRVDARRFDARTATNEECTAAFVDEVLTRDGEDTMLNEAAVLERFNAGLPVWR